MKRKPARKAVKSAKPMVNKKADPAESSIVQFGIAFIVVASFALLAYSIKAFVPTP